MAADIDISALIKQAEDAQAEVLAARAVIWQFAERVAAGQRAPRLNRKILSAAVAGHELDWEKHPAGEPYRALFAELKTNADVKLRAVNAGRCGRNTVAAALLPMASVLN